jgi:DNA-binding protein YbaB
MRTEIPAELASLLEDYRRTRSRIDRLSADVAALTATARSADGSVTATVGRHGELCDLRIDPELARRLDLKTLTSRILEASGLAAGQARDQLGRTVAAAMPAHLRHLVGPSGEVDPAALLPADVQALARRRGQERP